MQVPERQDHTSMEVTVHKQFSENLRALCLKRGTIAVVCRDLGINRQQFNKYLSGASLPNAATLSKLSQYFDVDQFQFFHSSGGLNEAIGDATHAGPCQFLLNNANVVRHLNKAASQSMNVPLQDGCYHLYYPWMLDPALLVRSVVVIFRNNGLTYFRRYTRLQTAHAKKLRNYPKGCHEGLIIHHDGNICFLGRNSIGVGEISLQSFAFENFVVENAITGLGLVVTPWGEYCSIRATISYFGPLETFRQALKLAMIGPVQKESVPPFIRHTVSTPLTSSMPYMRAFGHDDWLRILGGAQAPFEAENRTKDA